MQEGVSSRQPSGSRGSNSRRNLKRNESRRDQPSGYAEAKGQEEGDQPKRLSGWAKLRMARRMQGNVKAIQVIELTHGCMQCTCHEAAPEIDLLSYSMGACLHN